MTNAPPVTPPFVVEPITTRRLILRAPTRDDAPALVPLANDRGVATRLASMPHPYGPEDADYFFDEINPKASNWAITDGETKAFMGLAGFFRRTPDAPLELGYWLGRPFWGLGFATETSRAILAYAFAATDEETIVAGYFDGNDGSRRVLEKTGFIAGERSLIMSRALGREEMQTEMHLTRERWVALNLE